MMKKSGHSWENMHFSSKPRHMTPQNRSFWRNEHCSVGLHTHFWGFCRGRWENIHLWSKPRHVTPQIDHLGKTSTVLRVWTHIYGVFSGDRWENIHF